MKKKFNILISYPPGRFYQRGEDRSQGNLDNSVATAMRAPNDLGYVSAILKEKHNTLLRDYQTEQLSLDDFMNDVRSFSPDIVFFSITNSTIFEDLEICNLLKKHNSKIIIILKGALFYKPDDEIFKKLNLNSIDFLIGGEVEFIIGELIEKLSSNSKNFHEIDGIVFKNQFGWNRTGFDSWNKDLDSLPFPDRYSIKNELYTRPDTSEPMATIATTRGCGAKCTYCLTPVISGSRLRERTPQNIFDELKECVEVHNITNFFFKSDTFTMNRHWVEELCNFIVKSNLNNKIKWVANSRVNPLVQETLISMKQAGCWLVAFGFESGSPETLLKIKKGATVEQNTLAREMTKNAGLQCFGFFLVGLPWEKESHLEETKKHIYQLNCEFLELHIAVPYFGTNLYKEISDAGLLDESPLGKDYFNQPTKGTQFLTSSELERYRKRLLLFYHLRPSYIFNKLNYARSDLRILKNYFKYGNKLLKNNLI
jgi:anaerobic magnesium-protoporphyrin IX monomethyl ester cyclase